MFTANQEGQGAKGRSSTSSLAAKILLVIERLGWRRGRGCEFRWRWWADFPARGRYTGSMNFRKSVGAVFALFVVFGGLQARAQFGVYGMYQGTRLSGVQCLNAQTVPVGAAATSSTAPACANGTAGYVVNPAGAVVVAPSTGSLNFTGGFGGVYYDWRNFGPARIGFDVRAGETHSNKSASSGAGGADATATQDVLAGVRASFHTPIKIVRPYVQGSVGWGRSNITEPFGATNGLAGSIVPPRQYDNFIEYEGFVGVDLKLFSIMDFRAIELGLGGMSREGSGQGSTTVGIQSVGIGIVFHLPAS